MRIIKFCSPYVLKYRYKTYLYFNFGLMSSLIVSILPYTTGKFIDELIKVNNKTVIIGYCIVFAILSILKSIFNYLSKMLYIKVQTNAAYDMNSYIVEHMKSMPISFFHNIDPVYLNQRINNDSNIVISFYIDFVLNIAINIVNLVLAVVLVTSVDIKLLLIFIILIGIYLTIYTLMKTKIYKLSLIFRENQSNLFSKLNEQLSDVKFIKIHNLSEKFKVRLDNSYEALYSSAIANQRLDSVFSLYDEGLSFIAQLLVFIIGGIGVINGSTTVGILTITVSYFNMLLNSIKYFFQLGKIYQSNLVSYERISSLLNIEKEHDGNNKLDNIEQINTNNLSFSYDEKLIINNLNIDMKKGNIYFLTGKNGAGKSTLINILMGLHQKEYTGNIYFNSYDTETVSMKSVRDKNMSIVEQEPSLIQDTLISNLTFNVESYDSKYLEYLINKLGLDTYIDKQDQGLDTIINPINNNVSGGEKQKIAIIRALLKRPNFLILDEPTSALDKSTVENLKRILVDIKKDTIILIVTHDKSLLDIGDINIDISNTIGSCNII